MPNFPDRQHEDYLGPNYWVVVRINEVNMRKVLRIISGTLDSLNKF